MERVKVDTDAGRISVRFADGKQGWIPVDRIEEFSSGKHLIPKTATLPDPYEMKIKTRNGTTINIPWDFVRHFCDPSYKGRELDQISGW